MNKQQLIQHMARFRQDTHTTPDEVWVGAGGALLMHGLKTQTNDIDAGCVMSTYNRVESKVGGTWKAPQGSTEAILELPAYEMDLHIQSSKPVDVQYIDGVLCYSLRTLLEQKMTLNRPKDQADIHALKQALAHGA